MQRTSLTTQGGSQSPLWWVAVGGHLPISQLTGAERRDENGAGRGCIRVDRTGAGDRRRRGQLLRSDVPPRDRRKEVLRST